VFHTVQQLLVLPRATPIEPGRKDRDNLQDILCQLFLKSRVFALAFGMVLTALVAAFQLIAKKAEAGDENSIQELATSQVESLWEDYLMFKAIIDRRREPMPRIFLSEVDEKVFSDIIFKQLAAVEIAGIGASRPASTGFAMWSMMKIAPQCAQRMGRVSWPLCVIRPLACSVTWGCPIFNAP
jgi:hypothetical protein